MTMSSYLINSNYIEPSFPPCDEYQQSGYIPNPGAVYAAATCRAVERDEPGEREKKPNLKKPNPNPPISPYHSIEVQRGERKRETDRERPRSR